MASSAPRGGERMIHHQDYIARIRYSNALPPPPNPPKLLDIPIAGLSQYTTPGFATRLSRDQPLNIEADAELGMPLDLVGMPGIFDGDESSIQAPLQAPTPHPHDRPLLRPISLLGKPKFADGGVSFLRRTEYISAFKSRVDSTAIKPLRAAQSQVKPVRPSLDKESPEAIREQVEKSFKVAATSLKEPTRIKHPTKRSVTLVDAYPFLPDLDAFPDAGGYLRIRFLTNPVPPSSTYDVRLLSSLLQPINPTEEETQRRQDALAAHELDPTRNPKPNMSLDYDFFLTETPREATNFKRKFDCTDAARDDESLYPNVNSSGEACFRFKRIRTYETAVESGDASDKYDGEVAVALHDGTDGLHQKAAHYYPIMQRSQIRPQRAKNITRTRYGINDDADAERTTDIVDVTVIDPDEETQRGRDVYRDYPYGHAPLAADDEDDYHTPPDAPDDDNKSDD